MRAAFSDALVRLAVVNPDVLLLTGDHGYALFDEFRKRCPDQYINAGIAEQNMVGMAAGLARMGYRPFVYGLSAFVPIRVLEQIKLDVAHDNLPVIFIGDGAGFVYSHLGTSHQSTEDIAATRAISGLSILSPGDRHEVMACMHAAYDSHGAVYLRMGKSDRGDVHAAALAPLRPGQLLPVLPAEKPGISFIATGAMLVPACTLATEFERSAVWSAPYIKPIDNQQVITIARDSEMLIVLEEHSTYGGLGSAVAEIVSEHAPKRVLRIGVQDRYSEHCGTYDYLLKEHGLDLASLRARIHAFKDAT